MFGTAGIRGIYGKDITEDLAYKISNIFSEGKLVIGRDIRQSGLNLLESITLGASENGSDVIDIGILPTPTTAVGTKKYRSKGIMITASHNPEQYNGFKLIENGSEISKHTEKEIEKRLSKYNKTTSTHRGEVFFDKQIVELHKQLVLDNIDQKTIAKKAPKVIIDCNGAGSVITPSLLTDIGCQVTSINTSLEGFSRPSEPNEKNLELLSSLVRKSGADFGLAHDGDADRCVVIDELGQMMPLDVQLAIMIEEEMKNKKAKKIVSTVEASLTIREVVENNGGKIDITPVGSSYVCHQMEENKAHFGGEPCGEYIYEYGVHVPDAMMACAKFAEIFCQSGKFSQIRKKYKQHHIHRDKFPSKDKFRAIERIKKLISIRGKIRADDGIRVDEEDGWFLIRASGTEPIVRLTMEYREKKKLDARKESIEEIIKKNV
ncbi:MAG: phosphoglucosamine mutase [Candidatus Bilamarchaeum sp.]